MIYLDNSATTRPYKEVVDSFAKVSLEYFGNPSSLHGLGAKAEKLLFQARRQVAGLLKVKESEILFTSGGTESNNLAIKGTALMHRKRGRHIITTAIEHASVREAFLQLEELGFEVDYLPVDSEGFIQLEDIKRAVRDDTILVSVIHINNEVGTIQPIKEIGNYLKKFPKVYFHVDHVQGAGKVPLDFYDCGVDLASVSAHKFHGLKGTGALFIREGVQISSLFSGGSQEQQKRSGTENVAGMVAMAKALRMSMENHKTFLHQMNEVMETLKTELAKVPEITINTPDRQAAPHILNFSVKGLKAEVFVHSLEEQDIFVSTTSACSSRKQAPSSTLLAMGLPNDLARSAIRVSLSYGNTLDEARRAAAAIAASVKILGEVMR